MSCQLEHFVFVKVVVPNLGGLGVRAVGIKVCIFRGSKGNDHETKSYLYLYTLFDQCRVDIIDQVEYGVHDRLHIYPLCGIFYFPWHRHQIEGTDGF